MKNIFNFLLRFPFIPLIIIGGILVFSAFHLKKLNIDTSERSLILQDDEDLTYYDETIEKFVSDNIELVYINDKNIFTQEKLVKIETLIDELTKVDGIIKIESLFNVTNIRNQDDFLNLDHFIQNIPENQEDIDKIKADALRNKMVVSNLISKSGEHFVLKCYLDDEKIKDEKLFEIMIVNNIQDILTSYKDDFTDIFQTGNPFLKKSIYDTIQRDGKLIFPISIFIMLLMLIVTMRSMHGAFLPLLTSAISVIATISFMNLVKIPMNLLTFIVPSLVIVIGSTEDIHILSEYFEGLHTTRDKKTAINLLGQKVGTAIIITSLTTFLGFLSVSINNILVIRQFGIAAAFSLFINPCVTIMLAPLYLKFFGPKYKDKRKSKLEDLITGIFDKIAEIISGIILKRSRIVIGVFIGLTVIFALFILRVKLEYDLLNNFKKTSQVNKNIKKYEKNISGINTFFIRVKGYDSETFLKPDYLKQVDSLIAELDKIPEIDNVIGITDYLKLLNREINYGEQEYYTIPATYDEISQYFLLLDPVEIQKFITNDYNEINIIIKHSITSSYELNKLIDKINKIIPRYTENAGNYRLTGFQILTKKTSRSIATETIKGIVFLTIIIFIIMSILFLNLKAGLISLLSNSFPVIFTFGLMGILGIPLNIGSCLVGMIVLGLAVDDTIHLMSKYKIDMREEQDAVKGIKASVKSELRPAFSTSASLAMLFLFLNLSHLTNIKNFGLLSGLVIIYAFICDVFLTPTLLTKVQLITIMDLFSLKIQKEILNSKLFEGLKINQVKELLLLGKIHEIKKGDYLIRENERGDHLDIILEGEVEVSHIDEQKGQRVNLANFKNGDIIGELAVLMPIKRTADIIAKTDVRYFEVNYESLKRIERMKPKIVARIFHNLSCILAERIVNLNKKYMNEIISPWGVSIQTPRDKSF